MAQGVTVDTVCHCPLGGTVAQVVTFDTYHGTGGARLIRINPLPPGCDLDTPWGGYGGVPPTQKLEKWKPGIHSGQTSSGAKAWTSGQRNARFSLGGSVCHQRYRRFRPADFCPAIH